MTESSRSKMRLLGTVLGVALIVGLVAAVLTVGWTAPEEELDLGGRIGRIAVLPVQNNTGEIDQDWVRLALAEMIADTMAETAGVQVVSPERVTALVHSRDLRASDAATRDRLRALVPKLGASLVADFELRRSPRDRSAAHERYELNLMVLDDKSTELLSVAAVGPDPVSLAAGLTLRLTGALSGQTRPLPMDRIVAPSPFLGRLYGMGRSVVLEADSAAEGCKTAQGYFDITLAAQPNFRAAQFQLARCERRLGNLAQARRLYFDVQTAAQNRGLRRRESDCYVELAGLEAAAGETRKGVELARRGLKLATDRGDEAVRLKSLKLLSRLALGHGEDEDALDLYDEMLERQTALGDRLGRAETLVALGNFELARSNHEAAENHLQEALGMVQDVGDLWTETRVLSTLGDLASRRGDPVAALDLWRRAHDFYAQRSETGYQVLLQRNIAETLLAQNDLESAEDAFQDLRELAIEKGDEPVEAMASANIAWILLRRGYPAIAKAHLDRAIALDRQLNNPRMLQRLIAWYAYEQGNYNLAITTLNAVKRQSGDLWSPVEEEFLKTFIAAREAGERLPLPDLGS